MPAASGKANYKTYEAQARMVRAIVAAHPDVRWNYKEIIECYGSDMTKDALNHRFRRLNSQAIIIREARRQKLDMKDMETDDKNLPTTQTAVDKNNIAKYFGQSTADGIQFQFRTIKRDADLLRQVERDGGDVANCLSIGGGSTTSTPSKPTPSRGAGGRSGTGQKRSRKPAIKRSDSEEDDDEDEDGFGEDWSCEETPTKRPKKPSTATHGRKSQTPTRRAAAKASATIHEASALLQDSESPVDAETPLSSAEVVPTSIFGDVERKPTRESLDEELFRPTGFSRTGTDEYFGGGFEQSTYSNSGFAPSVPSFENDGEI